ncbi:hypothetical protein F01_460267 [Burkholderia cenocepacia]|nr:hypothetical protein F01_460267 [Burkholderia cenocepacia]
MHKVDIRSLQLRCLRTIDTSQQESSIYKFPDAFAIFRQEFQPFGAPRRRSTEGPHCTGTGTRGTTYA